MNNERRKQLKEAIKCVREAQGKMDDAKEIILNCSNEEQDAFDNLSESLQESERGTAMQEKADTLSSLWDTLNANVDELDDFIGELEEVIE